jgi:putative ABC transport system permease protein
MLQRIAGVGARWLTRHRVQAPRLSLSLANIARPGAPTGAVVTAFGVALTVFVALAVIEGNFQRQISEGIPAGAPAYYFIDIQPHQVTGFDAAVGAVSGVGAIRRMPALRGRIIAVNGTPVGEMRIGPGARWAVRGDRGMTYARRTPPGTEIVSGAWWPADYRGPPLVSIDARIARGFGVGLGDSITYNILGRRVTARIANTRHIDWATLGLNFTMIFTPGTLEGAPYTHIATVKATPEAEDALARAVTDRFANVTAVRVRDALQSVARILERIGAAARAMAALALGAGVLVLAGAIAAGRRQRTLDAVILKVTGARKRDLAVAYVIEYGIGGAAAAVPAAVLGTVAAFFVLTQAMHIGWVLLPAPVLGITSVAALAVIGCGFVGTWRALDRRPAEVLRDSRD